jgi:hypothetical protein
MVDFTKIQALADEAAKTKNMTEASKGGGDYTPPAAGFCKLRFISYIELGIQPVTFQGVTTNKPMCRLAFEVSGPRHPPHVNAETGVSTPIIISFETNLSMNEKAAFFKLFNRMNYAGKARHIAQLLGEAYIGTVEHRKYPKRGEDKTDQTKWTGIDVSLKNKDGFTIKPPRLPNAETGDETPVNVEPAKTPLTVFLWELADLEQWASIYIDGEWPERKDDKGVVTQAARSKNVLQAKIKSATNFKGSPIYTLLLAGGQNLDVPDSTQDMDDDNPEAGAAPTPTPQANAAAQPDPLGGIA